MRNSTLLALSVLAAGCTVRLMAPAPPTPRSVPPLVVQVMTYTPWPTATPVPTVTPLPPTPEPTAAPTFEAAAAFAAPPPAALAPTAIPPVLSAPPPSDDVSAAEQYTVDLINLRRAEAGVAPLARDETLMGIARARVADMAARGYTGHHDPVTGESLGRAWMRAAGFTSVFVGENWYGTVNPPPLNVEVAMAWFMTDPPHAKNILSPNYVAVGVGIGYNGRQWILVQNFAGPN